MTDFVLTKHQKEILLSKKRFMLRPYGRGRRSTPFTELIKKSLNGLTYDKLIIDEANRA